MINRTPHQSMILTLTSHHITHKTIDPTSKKHIQHEKRKKKKVQYLNIHFFFFSNTLTMLTKG
ncbi:hypothetical protein DM02DRAFT_84721 [Periconia macrospinosa]|uniref:Uncharacterized protein n=1 Tax=Periconia macrospinosa TaxID=97972 RepID=A0A2V1E4U3_9PLEO|nr:hypothetical protein DM02DRAFT_84721 [Periconia macrospinosa]